MVAHEQQPCPGADTAGKPPNACSSLIDREHRDSRERERESAASSAGGGGGGA